MAMKVGTHDIPRPIANDVSDLIHDLESVLEALHLVAAGLNIDSAERDAIQLVAQFGCDKAAAAKALLHVKP